MIIPPFHESAFEVIISIKQNTTKEDFEAILAQNPHYRLHYADNTGRTALSRASTLGNAILTRHILQKGGNDLVKIEANHTRGLTPLILTSFIDTEKERAFFTAQVLIRAGVNINSVTKTLSGTSITALSVAELANNIPLIHLLLARSAKLPDNHEIGSNLYPNILNVHRFLTSENFQLFNIIHLKKKLPPEIVKLVIHYLKRI